MAKPKHEEYLIDIQIAMFEGLEKLFTQWQDANTSLLDPQKLRAAIETLIRVDEKIWNQFCIETGHDSSAVNQWIVGRKFPTEQMASIYLGMLIRGIELRKSELLVDKNDILNQPKNKVVPEEVGLKILRTKIIGFQVPPGLSKETELSALKGFNNLPARLLNCLKNERKITVKDLIEVRGSESWQHPFLMAPNFGQKSLEHLYTYLTELGFEPEFEEE